MLKFLYLQAVRTRASQQRHTVARPGILSRLTGSGAEAFREICRMHRQVCLNRRTLDDRDCWPPGIAFGISWHLRRFLPRDLPLQQQRVDPITFEETAAQSGDVPAARVPV